MVKKRIFESEVKITFAGNRIYADDLDDYKQQLIESLKQDHEIDLTSDDIVDVVEVFDDEIIIKW